MPANFPAILFLFLAIILPAAFVICGGFPATLTLERAFPTNNGVEISKLRARDMARHGRILKSSDDRIIDFPVQGTYDPYLVGYLQHLFFVSYTLYIYLYILLHDRSQLFLICFSCMVVHFYIIFLLFLVIYSCYHVLGYCDLE